MVTHSEKGSTIYTEHGQGETIQIPVAKSSHVVNPTGAGDALSRGGFFAAHLAGLPLPICGRVGALPPSMQLSMPAPLIMPSPLNEFQARYAENFGAEPALATLEKASV